MKASELIAHIKLITDREGDLEVYTFGFLDGSAGPAGYPTMRHVASKKKRTDKTKFKESGDGRTIIKSVIYIP